MKQRPAACLALLVFLLLAFLPARLFYEPRRVTEKCDVQVTGSVSRQIQKDDKTQIYLKTCQVWNEKLSFETEKLLIYLSDTTEYAVGTDLSLSGTIYPMEEPTNPGQFNSKLYYQGKGIAYSVYAEHVEVMGVHPSPVRQTLLRIKKRIGQVYEQVYSEQNSSLLRAMVLGEKEELDAEVKELYQKNGISHLLAISGLHISLVGMGIYRFLRKLTGSYAFAGIPSVLFLCAYGWMTGASVSTVRASAMCGLAILADLTGRTYDMLTAIGVSALVLMITNPLSVRQSGFLLSFGAVLGIALIQPLWALYRKKMSWVGSSLSVSVSVFFVTFPLLLRFFFTYPLYSTFLNLMAIPFMSILMMCGILCGLIGLFCLPAAGIVGIPCSFILSLYEWAGKGCLTLPGAVQTIGNPSGWKLICYYTVLCIALFSLYGEKRRKKYWRKQEPFHPRKRIAVVCMGMMLTVSLLLCFRVHKGLEITMLDVGQGDSIFFQSHSGTTFLYDGGSTSEKNVGIYRILPFLQSKGVGMLDYVLISHMDQDHMNGIQELLEESKEAGSIKIGHAVLPDVAEKDEAYLKMEDLFLDAKVPIIYMGTGDRLAGERLTFTCLHPSATDWSDDRNDLSMVLLAEYGEFQMLLTGDIGKLTEKELVSSGLLTQVEVLKTAHHGSKHSSTEEFLSQVRPTVSLISCSAENRYGHPGEETLKRLLDVGSRIKITKDCGAIRVWTDGNVVRVRGFVEDE